MATNRKKPNSPTAAPSPHSKPGKAPEDGGNRGALTPTSNLLQYSLSGREKKRITRPEWVYQTGVVSNLQYWLIVALRHALEEPTTAQRGSVLP